jgi:hypothetical protein
MSNFLGDYQANFARSKKNTDWIRKNDPTAYEAMTQSRNFLSQRIPTFKTPRQRANAYTPRRQRYQQQKDVAFPFGANDKNSFKQWNQELPSRLERRGKLPELESPVNSGKRLPDLRKTQRGVAPLPTLQSKPRPVLPDLEYTPTSWNKPSFEAVTSKHNGRSVVNPVNDSVKSMGAAKPVTQVITPKAPKASSKDAKRLLKNLGVAGIVGGGMLGAYGLKKYADSRKQKN